MIKKLFYPSLLLLLVTSCVPRKNIIYLQGNEVSEKEMLRLNNQPYRVQVDDVLSINVRTTDPELLERLNINQSDSFNGNTQGSGIAGNTGNQMNSNLSGYSIDRDGFIRYPFFGRISVLGLTEKEIRKKLEGKFAELFKQEREYFIEVRLTGIKFTVLGEVGNPGPRVIAQNRLSIIDAITSSGDITEYGNKKEVEVLRYFNSVRKKYTIDLTKIDAFNNQVFYVRPHDYIIVKPLPQKALGLGTTALSTLSNIATILSLITSIYVLSRSL